MEISHDLVRSPAMQRGNYNKRCAIISAATAVFVRDGYVGASIDAIAEEANVSRQTIYNQIGDKERLFVEVVRGINEQGSARLVETLATFPDAPQDIGRELVEFAIRLTRNCLCDEGSRALRKLIENEGSRYPELFETWKDYGPGKNWPAISARFARLAHDGDIELDDPDLAARQFMALIRADLPNEPGATVSDAELEQAARNGVRTFLRAYGKRDAALAL
ncbi:TetR family transcriptional regulator [Devosia sp. Root413D1]|uniref:TetR/AcrR family transcriptional regulator n=1 Tax=Devosia sp. Root413D1 TaxID=1736531 RepID=UPI0006FD0DE7|nr:TetR/AcrR family transcriptional regulator [Devosia sp. Root413D1]KQW81238.1 TetR family transcriptional regulator [Devosia sp. Root413D1]